MSNKNYKRGYAFERSIVNAYRDLGWVCARTAGSHSPIDVVCFKPETMEVIAIQCKNKVMNDSEVNREVVALNDRGLRTTYKTAVRVYVAYKEKGHVGHKLRPA